jgi:hypothetical protein
MSKESAVSPLSKKALVVLLPDYYQITTSPHEGTHFKIKTLAAAVAAHVTVWLTKARRAISLQGTLKMGQLSQEATNAICTNTT